VKNERVKGGHRITLANTATISGTLAFTSGEVVVFNAGATAFTNNLAIVAG